MKIVKQRKTKNSGLPTYDSIAQCAAATGIPVSRIRAAKASGCPAFKAHRIFLGLLLPWLFKNSKASAVDEAKQKYQVMEANLMEERFKEESGANRREHMEAMKMAMGQLLSPLRSKMLSMPNMLSSRVNPSDPEMARAVLDDFIGDVLKAVQQV